MEQGSDDVQQRRMFWLLVAAAFAVRIALIATTIGTTDVAFKMLWAKLATQFGIAGAYAHHPLLNHPPLSLAIMLAEKKIGGLLHIEYTDVFRAVQVAADALTATVLYRIGRRASARRARWLTLFFLLSPAAAAISGFHCNTDSTMVALTISAAALILAETPHAVAAGAVLACAANIKIIPLLLVPLFLVRLANRQRIAFCFAFAAVFAVLLGPAVVVGGPVVLRNVFSYTGMDRDWGFPRITTLMMLRHPPMTHAAFWMMVIPRFARYLIVAAIAAMAIAGVKRNDIDREFLLPATGALMLFILFVAPGFGIQYLVWPIAFLPFALGHKSAVALNAGISLFVLATYTIWSEGFPWWFADADAPHRLAPPLWNAGLALWLAVGAAAAIAITRVIRGSRNSAASQTAGA